MTVDVIYLRFYSIYSRSTFEHNFRTIINQSLSFYILVDFPYLVGHVSLLNTVVHPEVSFMHVFEHYRIPIIY